MVQKKYPKKVIRDEIENEFMEEEDLNDLDIKLDKEYDRNNEIESKKFRVKKKHKTEDSSTVEGVLDLSTAKEVYKLQKKGYLKGLGGIISCGKEANVYFGKSFDKELTYSIDELAVKIYRTRTLDFKKIRIYIEGDIRFSKTGKKSHQIIQTWALKEFKNLSRSFASGLLVPRPIIVRRNVVIMEFIGINGSPAPQLRHYNDFSDLGEIESYYNQIVTFIDTLWNKVNLVHGDLSAYNVLVLNKKIYFIDMGQAVLKDHHLALSFLFRDINNILYYFDKFNIEIDEAEALFERITGFEAIPELLKL